MWCPRIASVIVSWSVAAVAAVVVTGASQPAAVPTGESDPVLTASALIGATPLVGPDYTIEPAVHTPGNYHVFSVTSPFGVFEAEGLTQVEVRLQEIAALRRLEELSRAGVFARSAGESLVKVGTGVVNAVTDPVETAKGIGGGVKRFGVNLGRRTKRAVQRLTDDSPGGSDSEKGTGSRVGGAAASAAKSLIGINSARRRWARRVGADPYSTNPVLKDALERIAAVDAAGGIATSVVVPIPPIVGTTAKVGDLVWGTDPEELRKLNESRARDIGTTEDDANAFFRNRAFTLTMQTRLVGALAPVGVPGAGDYLASAAEAGDHREALFFVESAEMLQREHEASPVARVLTDSRAIVAQRASGEAIVVLPVDWLRAAETTGAEFTELARRAKAELGASTLRLVVSGTVTDVASAALAAAGWRR
jgi:hypothetical protein